MHPGKGPHPRHIYHTSPLMETEVPSFPHRFPRSASPQLCCSWVTSSASWRKPTKTAMRVLSNQGSSMMTTHHSWWQVKHKSKFTIELLGLLFNFERWTHTKTKSFRCQSGLSPFCQIFFCGILLLFGTTINHWQNQHQDPRNAKFFATNDCYFVSSQANRWPPWKSRWSPLRLMDFN